MPSTYWLTVDEDRAIAFWLHHLAQLQSIKEIHAEYAGLGQSQKSYFGVSLSTKIVKKIISLFGGKQKHFVEWELKWDK